MINLSKIKYAVVPELNIVKASILYKDLVKEFTKGPNGAFYMESLCKYLKLQKTRGITASTKCGMLDIFDPAIGRLVARNKLLTKVYKLKKRLIARSLSKLISCVEKCNADLLTANEEHTKVDLFGKILTETDLNSLIKETSVRKYLEKDPDRDTMLDPVVSALVSEKRLLNKVNSTNDF